MGSIRQTGEFREKSNQHWVLKPAHHICKWKQMKEVGMDDKHRKVLNLRMGYKRQSGKVTCSISVWTERTLPNMGRQTDQGASRQAGREEEGKRGTCGVQCGNPSSCPKQNRQPERTKHSYPSRCGWAHRDKLGCLPPPLSPSSDRTWGREQTPTPARDKSMYHKCKSNHVSGCRAPVCASIPLRHWLASTHWADRSHAGGCGGNQRHLHSSLRCCQPFQQISILYTRINNTQNAE